ISFEVADLIRLFLALTRNGRRRLEHQPHSGRMIMKLRIDEALGLWPQLPRHLVYLWTNDAELVSVSFVQTGPGHARWVHKSCRSKKKRENAQERRESIRVFIYRQQIYRSFIFLTGAFLLGKRRATVDERGESRPLCDKFV